MDIIEILGRIGFDWRVFLFNLVNFIIVAFILWRFFFKKVVATIEERQTLIADGIQNAESAKSELAMSEQKAEELIKEAKQKANAIVKEAGTDAEKVATEIKSQAEADIAHMRERSQEQIAKEKQALREEFKQEAAELVVLATQKLLADKGGADKKAAAQAINSVDKE